MDKGSQMAKTYMMRIRIEETERQGFEEAATLSGLSLSAWARERLRGAARRELTEVGKQVPFYQRGAGDA